MTTRGNELTSNYLAWRARKNQKGSSPEVDSEAVPQTFQQLDPVPLDQRRLLDVLEFIELARTTPQRRLVLVRNSHVGLLVHDVGYVEPLWTGWNYSVWEIPGKK